MSSFKEVLWEAFCVVAVGASLGTTAFILRGKPSLPAREENALSCSSPIARRPEIRWVEVSEAITLQNDPSSAFFVDARSHEEFVSGHIASAVNLPMDSGAAEASDLVRFRGVKPVVAYCDTSDSCGRSVRLAALLSESGAMDVRVLRGGFPAWLSADGPAEGGE